MDIARAVEQIYDNADFRRSDTYANLQKTWRDARKVPTEAQLMIAWEDVQQADVELAVQKMVDTDHIRILRDDLLLTELTYEQRIDLLTNVLRMLIREI